VSGASPSSAILFSASSFFVGGFFEKGKAKRTVLRGSAGAKRGRLVLVKSSRKG
jgi:hypothetical protein